MKTIENKLKRMKRKDYLEKIVNDGYIKVVKQDSSHRSMDRT